MALHVDLVQFLCGMILAYSDEATADYQSHLKDFGKCLGQWVDSHNLGMHTLYQCSALLAVVENCFS